ncbi:hypothetical protein [Bacillus toyonensis]|uniref:hypothetical protein n=1 Tax=Bacillus toyonensis TaxID=155322 RepID=UPI002E242197|nr:hypothetical protein [Bacillus toyonensis]
MTKQPNYTYNEEDEIIVTDDMILDNEIIGVDFIRKYENKEKGFKAYEFQTNEWLYFDFVEQSDRNFRLEITKDYVSVSIAYFDDYTVMENVSYAFDIVDLLQRVLLQNDIYDEQEEYDEWWEKEGKKD